MSYADIEIEMKIITTPSWKNCAKNCAKCFLGLLSFCITILICYYVGKLIDTFYSLPNVPEHDYNGIARYTIGGMIFISAIYCALFLCIRLILSILSCVKFCMQWNNTNNNTNSTNNNTNNAITIEEIILSEVELDGASIN